MQKKPSRFAPTIYWHDYETFGANPKKDRPVQFAGIRTDEDLNIIGEPLVIYAKPADDYLPDPVACMVTGISPQLAEKEGKPETEFMAQILKEFSRPNSCVSGYNNIRFDDEFTRYSLYRNLYDPYAREWQNGNSRWDIIDLVRVTNALRPEGINWPEHENGLPSFRLEDLTVANGISHESAHDALSDVEATIAIAKLIKQKQPKLYDYVFNNRNKRVLANMLDMEMLKPVLHTSSMFPAEYHCTTLVVPLIQHPRNSNGIVVYDLRHDPQELLDLTTEQIRQRLYTKTEDLAEGESRIALKTIHLNKCPIIVPAKVDEKTEQRLKLDKAACQKHLQQIRDSVALQVKLVEVFDDNPFDGETDPDFCLYGGSFFSDHDKNLMAKIHKLDPFQLAEKSFDFQDERLDKMLFRYRARNYPESLLENEKETWQEFCQHRLCDDDSPNTMNLNCYRQSINELLTNEDLSEDKIQLLKQLRSYGEQKTL